MKSCIPFIHPNEPSSGNAPSSHMKSCIPFIHPNEPSSGNAPSSHMKSCIPFIHPNEPSSGNAPSSHMKSCIPFIHPNEPSAPAGDSTARGGALSAIATAGTATSARITSVRSRVLLFIPFTSFPIQIESTDMCLHLSHRVQDALREDRRRHIGPCGEAAHLRPPPRSTRRPEAARSVRPTTFHIPTSCLRLLGCLCAHLYQRYIKQACAVV